MTLRFTDPLPPEINQFHFETWQLFHPFYLIYCIPVTVHYLLVLRIIRKVKDNNAFFFIFFVMGTNDFLYLCCMLICVVLHYTQWLGRTVFVMFVVSSYVGNFFNLLSNSLLSINRFCATSVSYNTYFQTKRIKIYFIGILLVSIVAAIPVGALMLVFLKNDWSLESFNIHRSVLISTLIADGILGLVLSIATMYRLRKHNINYDKSLLLVTSLHILPDILVSLFNLDMLFQITGSSLFANELSRMFLFFLVSFNSLTIVCTNRMIRRRYLKMFVFWRDTTLESSKVGVSTISTARQSQKTSDKVTIL